MRVAVISDIHGNCVALDAALADLPPVDRIVCLGDAIQGGAQPHETAQRLRSLNFPIVMGNADAWLLTGKDTSTVETITPEKEETRLWSLSQLSGDDIEFIQSFQPTVTVSLSSGQDLLCFHGSPRSFDDIIFPETPEVEFHKFLGDYKPAILTGGHTHVQQIRRLDNTFFFNPGSLGFAYNRNLPEDQFRADPWADYAILSYQDSRPSLEFRRVPFDADQVIQIYLASGRPHAEEAAAQYRRAG